MDNIIEWILSRVLSKDVGVLNLIIIKLSFDKIIYYFLFEKWNTDFEIQFSVGLRIDMITDFVDFIEPVNDLLK